MHNGFIDKRRRHLTLRENQIESVLPEHFGSAYPKFIKLLEEYYEWQDAFQPTELLNHLFASRDINETDVTLLSFIEDELLLGDNYFEGFGQSEAEKRAAANFSSTLFRAKGSKFAIEWFFRSFYGLDAEVLYPKEDIFNVSDTESRIGPDYLNFLTDDKLYQTYALLIRVGIPITSWSEVFKKFVHPAGMYLGSEVLLSSTDIGALNIFANDSAGSIARVSKSYSLTNDGPTTEGEATTFQLVGTDIPEGIDAVFAYITHGTTTDSDFPLNAFTVPAYGNFPAITSKIPLLNDSAGPRVININSSEATFTLRSWIDSDGGASTEDYTMNIIDQGGRSLASTLVTINNAEPSYSLSPSSSTPNEGDVITFTVNGSNVPYDGSTSLYYQVVHGTTNDSDFTVAPQQDADLQDATNRITLSGSTGAFSLKTIIDEQSDDAEEFTVNIRDSKKLLVASTTVSVQQVTSEFQISAENIVEGDQLILAITVNQSEIGDSLTYVITNGDARIELLTETFVVPAEGEGSFVKVIPTTISSLYEGTVTPTITVTNNVTNASTQTTFDLTDVTPTWGMISSPEFAVEGNTITFSVDGTNIPDPTTVWFEILHGTTVDADFTTTPPQTGTRSSTVINDPGDTVFQITVATDSGVADESFTARLYDAETGGNLLASLSYVIQGTNTSYALSPSTSSVNEGGQVTFTFTTNQPSGTYYWWIPTGSGYSIQAADFSGAIGTLTNRSSFVVTAGTGTIVVNLLNDTLTEGTESFNVLVSNSNNYSVPPVVSSGTVTVNDTSVTTFTLSLNPSEHTSNSVSEGNTVYLLISVDNNQAIGQSHYMEVTGAGVVGRFPIQQRGVAQGQYPYSTFFTTSASAVYEGAQVATVTLSNGNYASLGGTLLDTLTFNLVDLAPAMTLTPNSTTGTEGSTITYTVGGTNIQDGTYYWYDPAIIKTIDVPFGLSSGTSQINHQGSQVDIAVGMSTDDAGIPGTVTGVFSNYITMSDPTTRATVTGEHIKFAFPANFADATAIYGTVAVSSNAGNFDLATQVNSDHFDDVWNIRVFAFESQYNFSGTNLGLATSATVTITDTNPVTVNLEYSSDNVGASDNILVASSFNFSNQPQTTILMTEYNHTGQGIVWKNSIPHYATGGTFYEDFGDPPFDDNWILPVGARSDYIGSNFQMNVRFYNDSQRTIPTVPGQQTGGPSGYSYVYGERFVNGVNVAAWDNTSTQWWVVGTPTQSGVHYYRHIATTTPSWPNDATVNNFRWATVTIKEYNGTLGTGTTLVTYNYQSGVNAYTSNFSGIT